MPYDDGFLPAWSWGAGTDVALLVHGWEGRGSQLARFAEPLLRERFRVVAFDAPGHGDTRSRRGSVVDHARAVDAVARYVGRVDVVIGHSVGAAASLLATRFGFEPRRFVLISPPIGPARFAAGFVQMLELSKGIESGMVGRLQRRYGMALDELDACADASKVLAPVLVVHDKGDKVVPEGDGEAIARSAPQGRLMATAGLGHYRILKDPTVLEEAVRFATEGRTAAYGSFAATLDGELFFRENRR
ncbi:Hydrolase [Labilithrix luteola]|uniref:Hydrolase n=1 Tax=Labilithrix luteola TaxID=1391654 RepID=A0A0K1Q8E3_9BACT|nr:Hydrolase [Labilithrix luteola]